MVHPRAREGETECRSICAGRDGLFLANHFLLKHLNAEELRRLATGAAVIRHGAQETIFQKGDPGDSMMAVLRGRVKICTYSSEGRELVLNIIDRGGVFGEIALLDGRPRTADAVALEETELLVLQRGRFMPFLANNPELVARLFAVLCGRLRQTSAHQWIAINEMPSAHCCSIRSKSSSSSSLFGSP